MIALHCINQHYGGTQILWDLDLKIEEGSCVCVIGRNGVGKTTLLKCLMGLLPLSSGKISVSDTDFSEETADKRAREGIGYVPQGREIFPLLTVEENLRIGLGARTDNVSVIPQKIFELFPVLHEMLMRRGGDLSGGQQQQLAIARALVIDPKILILDEPNEGIQPNIVAEIGRVITYLNKTEGITVLLVEQKIAFARKVCKEFRLMEKGRIVASGLMNELSDGLISKHLAV
ncbi:MAG: urea ABC transporter ATP-binding subunit UrtE [Cellvibrionales bacterium TMED49]|nr:urea ABC transporter ATP-binding subunit UrtE [Porticoccaceae bacterium]OUU39072.1 MAG: urea ABC transporter ATP-binding subunit UrtE [Cellvibrionales bacterium TMED49]